MSDEQFDTFSVSAQLGATGHTANGELNASHREDLRILQRGDGRISLQGAVLSAAPTAVAANVALPVDAYQANNDEADTQTCDNAILDDHTGRSADGAGATHHDGEANQNFSQVLEGAVLTIDFEAGLVEVNFAEPVTTLDGEAVHHSH